ncbi:MAG: transposase [Azospirillaceae bacterium]|nr:transposase [Azospirillaceae bacterium]
MAQMENKTKRYASNLNDKEWLLIEPLLPQPKSKGCSRQIELRELLNALRYLARSDHGCRMLPVHFLPWQTVYWWFQQFGRRLLFQITHDIAVMMDRERAGREGSPSAGMLDSQSVKAPSAKERGFDGGKKVTGRKRHIAVDTEGRLLMVNLTPADISDSVGAQQILDGLRKRWLWMTRWRRLVRDYESRIDVSKSMIQFAVASLLLRRVFH